MRSGEVALSPKGEIMGTHWDYHGSLPITILVKLFVGSYTGNSLHFYLGDILCYTISELVARSIYLDKALQVILRHCIRQ